jgi:hypothetical protein
MFVTSVDLTEARKAGPDPHTDQRIRTASVPLGSQGGSSDSVLSLRPHVPHVLHREPVALNASQPLIPAEVCSYCEQQHSKGIGTTIADEWRLPSGVKAGDCPREAPPTCQKSEKLRPDSPCRRG